jgi:hypothetical protein
VADVDADVAVEVTGEGFELALEAAVGVLSLGGGGRCEAECGGGGKEQPRRAPGAAAAVIPSEARDLTRRFRTVARFRNG